MGAAYTGHAGADDQDANMPSNEVLLSDPTTAGMVPMLPCLAQRANDISHLAAPFILCSKMTFLNGSNADGPFHHCHSLAVEMSPRRATMRYSTLGLSGHVARMVTLR